MNTSPPEPSPHRRAPAPDTATDILISFCRVSNPSLAALGLLNLESFAFRIVRLPSEILSAADGRWASVTGIALSPRWLYALLPRQSREPSELLILDRTTLELVGHHVFRMVIDAHSLWADNSRLYIISTGTDEVVAADLDGAKIVREEVIWRPDPHGPREDVHHLNAIYLKGSELFVCGFGRRESQLWSLTRNGFIWNLSRAETVVSGIHHPHSLVALGNELAFCESGTGRIRFTDGRKSDQLPGYARGLCLAGGKLFAATSIGRKVSKSTGLINNLNAGGVAAGRCTVASLALDTLGLDRLVDLGAYGSEIYDLVAVAGVDQWPLISSDEHHASAATWTDRTERLAQQIARLVPAEGTFVMVDQDCLTGINVPGRLRRPFLEKSGRYFGLPADAQTAIQELKRMRAEGALFLVFAWPAFWWLDYYTEFRDHLFSAFPNPVNDDCVRIFDLGAR